MENSELKNKFAACSTNEEKDAIYMTIAPKANADRSVGKPKFVKGHTYEYYSDQLGWFKDSREEEHAFIEVTFKDVNTGIISSTSIGFWRKSVPQAAGLCKEVQYESTVCNGLGSSDMEVLNALRGGARICCEEARQVASGLKYSESNGIKKWTGTLTGKTWVYDFIVE